MQEPTSFRPPQLLKAYAFIAEAPGFYIPAYQRHFSWPKENRDRFLEDIAAGLKRLIDTQVDNEHAVTFIGSMICFNDSKFKTVSPIFRNEMPDSVLTVIDGQQRLTILMMVSAALHDYIRRLCEDGSIRRLCEDGSIGEKLTDKARGRNAELERIIEVTRPTGDYPHYPRMICFCVDVWSRKGGERRYHSPLSYYISAYGEFARDGNNRVKAYKHNSTPPFSVTDEQWKAHKNFGKVIGEIHKNVAQICEGKGKDFPSPDEMLSLGVLSELLAPLEPDELNELKNLIDTASNEKLRQLAVATVLASYVLHKIYFVSLVTTDESCAFDMFESLNTTGQVLTAYETFKPEVVRFERLEQFEGSDSKKHIDAVDGFLDSRDNLNQKASVTAEMLISFAMAENGKKIGKPLRGQRQYLRERYGALSDAEKRGFTRHLMHSAEVMQHYWADKGLGIQKLFSDIVVSGTDMEGKWKTARFCLSFLKDANHNIARALFIRFHEAARMSDDSERETRVREVFEAIKAVAAFFALWRGSRVSTDGIDNCHRRLFLGDAGVIDSLARVNTESPLKAEDLRRAFRHMLGKEGGNSERRVNANSWLAYSNEIPVYRVARSVAKFLLLVASHNTKIDTNNPRQLVRMREGAGTSLITDTSWDDNNHDTMEHIIPQSWAANLSLEGDDLHRLGNLTLVPHVPNLALSNRPWTEKRPIYLALSAQDDRELNDAREKIGDFLSPSMQEKILQERYLPMTQAVAQYDHFGPRNSEGESIDDKKEVAQVDIAERGQNLAKLAWEILALDWLKFDESDGN